MENNKITVVWKYYTISSLTLHNNRIICCATAVFFHCFWLSSPDIQAFSHVWYVFCYALSIFQTPTGIYLGLPRRPQKSLEVTLMLVCNSLCVVLQQYLCVRDHSSSTANSLCCFKPDRYLGKPRTNWFGTITLCQYINCIILRLQSSEVNCAKDDKRHDCTNRKNKDLKF